MPSFFAIFGKSKAPSLTHDHRSIDLCGGDLRHPVTIKLDAQASTGTRGQPVRAATVVASTRASIEPLSGRKLEIARQLVPTATHEVVIRYRSGLTPKMWIAFGTRRFNIGGMVDVLERKQKLILTCSEDQSARST